MAVKKKIPPVLEIIRDNIIKHSNPLALKEKEVSSWAKDLNLPSTGKILFYTGGEYQLLPYIDSLVKTMTYLDPNSNVFSWLMEARKVVNATGISAEKIYASILAKDKERFNAVNYKAAKILLNLGYDICYDPNELYSGALLYELGFWKELKEYVPRVVERIKVTQADTIVCTSPHAAEMFKLIYPEITEFNIEVRTFIELVNDKKELLPKLKIEQPVVIHDSCRMARELDVCQEIRDILDAMNVKYEEPMRNGKWTTCCGGPSKFLFPEVSKTVSSRRVLELAQTGSHLALISCPYCLSALQSGNNEENNLNFEDLVEFIYRGYES